MPSETISPSSWVTQLIFRSRRSFLTEWKARQPWNPDICTWKYVHRNYAHMFWISESSSSCIRNIYTYVVYVFIDIDLYVNVSYVSTSDIYVRTHHRAVWKKIIHLNFTASKPEPLIHSTDHLITHSLPFSWGTAKWTLSLGSVPPRVGQLPIGGHGPNFGGTFNKKQSLLDPKENPFWSCKRTLVNFRC